MSDGTPAPEEWARLESEVIKMTNNLANADEVNQITRNELKQARQETVDALLRNEDLNEHVRELETLLKRYML